MYEQLKNKMQQALKLALLKLEQAAQTADAKRRLVDRLVRLVEDNHTRTVCAHEREGIETIVDYLLAEHLPKE
jgi:hypothetical protein